MCGEQLGWTMKIKYRKDALYDIRRMPKVIALLEDISGKIADRANEQLDEEGYFTGSRQGARKPYGRWRTSVVTGTGEAMRDDAKNNTLLRELNGSKF